MLYQPRPYQVPATELLERTNYRAMLGLRMGLGKSVIAATAAKHLLDTFETEKVLIVAPPDVARIQWPAEFKKWDHLKDIDARVLSGPPVFHRDAVREGKPVTIYRPSWLSTGGDVHFASYEQLYTRQVKDRIYLGLVDCCRRAWPYNLVIFDEAHRMKSPGSRRFRAFRKVITETEYRIALSGSFGANNILDMWGPAYLVDEGRRLGATFQAYKDRWFRPKFDGHGVEPLDYAYDEITDKLSDMCLMMRADFGLPEPIVNNVVVPFPARARAQYDRLKREAFLRLESGEVNAENPGVLTAKLEQMANGAVYDGDHVVNHVHDAKLDALEAILADGEPVLCVTQFKPDEDRIRRRFPFASGLDADAWNAGRLRLMVLQSSRGEGLNLQMGGRVIVWFCPTWNLIHYEQMNARLWRPGQKQVVVIHHLLAENSIDQVKLARLASKAGVQESLYEALS